jgi:hypothetical protein
LTGTVDLAPRLKRRAFSIGIPSFARRLRACHAWEALLLAAVFLLVLSRPFGPASVWVDLKVGQWLVEQRRLPEHDLWRPFADPEARFVDAPWLGQAFSYGLFHAGEALAGGDRVRQLSGGVALLGLGHALLVLLRYAVLFLSFRRLTGSPALACTGLVFLLLVDSGPTDASLLQALGELYFACLLLLLSWPVLSWWSVCAVPLLLVLWVNSAAAFLAGYGLLTACLLGRVIEAGWSEAGWKPGAAWADAQVRKLLLTGVLAAAAGTVLNPYGPELFGATARMAAHPVLSRQPGWKPLAFHPGWGVPWLFLISLVLLTATQVFSPRSFSPSQVLALLAFGVATCLQPRNYPWWAMLVPWVALPHWAAIRSRLSSDWVPPRVEARVLYPLLGALTLIPLARSNLWDRIFSGSPRSLDWSLSADTPWRLAAQLWTASEPGPADWQPEVGQALRQDYPGGFFTGTICTSPSQGDFLLWAMGPAVPVSPDSHLERFTEGFWEEFTTVAGVQPGWWELLDRRKANLVVVEAARYPRLCERLGRDPAWLVVPPGGPSGIRTEPFIALRKAPHGIARTNRS